MGKKNKKKGSGIEKTAIKTEKKLMAKHKKLLQKLGERDIVEVVASLEAKEQQIKLITEEVCSAPPSPRSSFSLVTHPEKEELILFGGEFFNGKITCVYNDLYVYNISKNEWKQIHSPNGPTPRSGHQMVAVATDGGQLWLFGGEYASPSQAQFYHYKDLWMMNLCTRKWEKVQSTSGPSARSGHRMVASKRKLFIFGGFHDNNQSYRYFNDMHIFSLESYTWLQVQIKGITIPPARSGCCMAANPEGEIIIWGGYSKSSIKKDVDRGITHTDMYSFVLDKKSHEPNVYKWIMIKATGHKPLPRSSVSCTFTSNGKAYCFGGVMDIHEDEDDLCGQFSDELLTLDLVSFKWHLMEINDNSVPDKRQVDKITSITGDNDIHMEDANEINQVQPTTVTDNTFTLSVSGSTSNTVPQNNIPSLFMNKRSKNRPSPRIKVGLCICKGVLYLYGGICEEDNKQNTYNDLYSLDLRKNKNNWKTIISRTDSHEWVDSDSDNSTEKSESNSDSESESETNSEMDTE